MTKEQHDRLSKYEQHFNTAYRLNYLRNLGREAVTELDEVYVELFGHSSKLKSGCSACVMSEVKRMAREYYDYQEPEEQPQETDNKPKKTRRKKENGI